MQCEVAKLYGPNGLAKTRLVSDGTFLRYAWLLSHEIRLELSYNKLDSTCGTLFPLRDCCVT